MTTDAPRPLEESAKVVGSARCNQCDRVIVAITTAGPGEHRAQCGHAVGSHSLAELATSRGTDDDDVRRAVDSSEEPVPDGGDERVAEALEALRDVECVSRAEPSAHTREYEDTPRRLSVSITGTAPTSLDIQDELTEHGLCISGACGGEGPLHLMLEFEEDAR